MSIDSRLDLSNVTICAVDCRYPQLASRALDISSRHCKFGDAILFTHADIPCRSRIVRTPFIGSHEEYSVFVLKGVIEHIRTPWVLMIQWDGYVTDPSAWRDDFLRYDYIGARWPHREDGMSVGNGGFSLRSSRLMEIVASQAFPVVGDVNEDEFICRHHRPRLESEYGIRFAPETVADQFSHELARAVGPTFGFHAVANLWRYVSEQDLREILDQVDPSMFEASATLALMYNFFLVGRLNEAKLIYAGLIRTMSPESVREKLVARGAHPEQAASFMRACAESGPA